MIKAFFKNLSKYSAENNLSDMTYFLCDISTEFQNFLLRFIFSNIGDDLSDVSIEQEYSSEDKTCRVDFKFEVNGKSYLLENKIYDKNCHYPEYTEAFKGHTIGFIANYDVSEIKYDYKKNWAAFHKELNENLLPKLIDDEKKLVEGYIEYLKGVCSIMDERDFNPTLTCDLEYLNEIFARIINEKSEQGLVITNRAKNHTEERSGKYIKYYKKNLLFWVWFGLYTKFDSNNICIELWERELSEFSEAKGKYFKKPQKKDEQIYFWLKKEKFDELSKDGDFSSKYEILSNFFDEVMGFVDKKFSTKK
ncbi:MAG: hypothetical protein ACRC4W_04620 [Treponemataceae bacterium]